MSYEHISECIEISVAQSVLEWLVFPTGNQMSRKKVKL